MNWFLAQMRNNKEKTMKKFLLALAQALLTIALGKNKGARYMRGPSPRYGGNVPGGTKPSLGASSNLAP